MKTIGELIEALSNKNPEGEFEILIQNDPDAIPKIGKPISHVVILVADGDFLRLN